MASPKVAVGIPVYNGQEMLRFTVESILRQTFTDLDVLIVDNASEDDTAAICEQLASEDSRVRYLRNDSNIGVFRNYDAAFLNTDSPFFKWCPVGDSCHPDFIARALAKNSQGRDDVVLVHSVTRPTGDSQRLAGFEAVLDLVDA